MTTNWQAELLEFIKTAIPEGERLTLTGLIPMAGGFSHETLRLGLRYEGSEKVISRRLVLRRQPEAGPLAPYDLEREARVLQCLARCDIPVPEVLWVEPTGEVVGSPFFIMEEVEGEPMPFFWRLGHPEDPRVAAHARMLRQVHEADWQGLGLAFLGDATLNPIEAEIERCVQRAAFHGVETDPLFREMAGWLTRHAPRPLPAALLHGDPNPANYIFRGDVVAAVVDWELASLGDPRTDLGFYLAAQTVFGGEWGVPYARFLHEYAGKAGSSLADMPYFEALGLLRMVAILLGLQGSSAWDLGDAWTRVQAHFRQVRSA